MISQVNHPSHYNKGRIEVIEYLEDQFMDRPHEWNAVKYISRANSKGKEVEDLEKAIWYIKRKLALLKGNTPRPNEMNERPTMTRTEIVERMIEASRED